MATYTWKGSSGSASDPTQYQTNIAPGPADFALFDTAGAYTLSGGIVSNGVTLTPPPDIGQYEIDAGSVTFDGAFLAASLNTQTDPGIYIGIAVAGGATAIFDANSTVTLGAGAGSVPLADTMGLFAIGLAATQGSNITGTGSAMLEGALQAYNLYIGDGATGAATITGTSAQVQISGQYGSTINVGVGATGTLTVENGATLTTSGFLQVGVYSPPTASTVLITGPDTTVNVQGVSGQFGNGSVEIGRGNSTLQVANGATLNAATDTQVEQGSSFIIDDTATITGGLVLDGGTFDAMAHAGATTPTQTNFTGDIGVQYFANTPDTVGSGPNAVLNLSGLIHGLNGNPADFTINAGTVILSGVNNTYSDTVVNLGSTEFGYTDLDGGTLDLAASGAAGTGDIRFDPGVNSALVVGAGALPANAITGFTAGDALLVTGLGFTHVGYAGSTLSLLTASNQDVGNLDIGTGYSQNSFSVSQGSAGVTIIACFAAGTRIATAHDDRNVEDLHPGDQVRAAHAGLAEIVWIGHREIDCAGHPSPKDVWPIRIRAGAYGPQRPARDLFLSPEHAMFIDGVLIPVRHLIDGNAITQVPCDTVTYFHIELTEHDLLLAEGLLVESYLETGHRAAFANSGPAIALHPNFVSRAREAHACAEILVAGPRVAAARARTVAAA